MKSGKIRVVWLCAIMNREIREEIGFKVPIWKRILNFRRKYNKYDDIARWNSNAIKVFEGYDDIELHVVSYGTNMLHSITEYNRNTICYHVLRDLDDILIMRLAHRLKELLIRYGVFRRESLFQYNRKRIISVIERVRPDVIHIIGAENISYSLSILDIPNEIPVIVQLQTLLSAPNVINNYPNLGGRPYERIVLEKARFVGTTVPYYKEVIQKMINPKVQFLDLRLAVQEFPYLEENIEKIYDFVYFSANINKAVDLAIDAFALAHKAHPEISLDIVGGYDAGFKNNLDSHIEDLGLADSIHFEGRLPTYEDVIRQIRKAKYALLPVKIDYLPSVIREAIANDLPVVSTITLGTPTLNLKRESILLSDVGNHQAMADNMIRLIEDKELVDRIRNNAIRTVAEMYNDTNAMNNWRTAYYSVISILN